MALFPAEFDPDNCPVCGISWIGEPIPAENRHYYGNKTHFKRKIGIYDFYSDMTVAYKCPDCATCFHRFTGVVIPEPTGELPWEPPE